MKYSLPFSIALHLILLISIQVSPSVEPTNESETENRNNNNIQIVPMKITEISVVEHKKGPSVKKVVEKKFKNDTQCTGNDWFGGIGVTSQELLGEIQEVYAGYPAEKAGILVGDRVVSTNGDIRGDPGTVLNITIFRASTNSTLSFSIIRDKICYGKRKE